MLTEYKAIYIPAVKQGRYDVVFEGKVVVTNSYSPFSDTARYLLSQGLDAFSFDTSLIEQAMVTTLGPDVTERITRQVVDAGDFDAEALAKYLAKYGVTEDMYQDALVHYQAAAEQMLAPINSSVAYLENFLSDAEAAKARSAIVARDMTTVQRLGEMAKNRAASMNHKEVTDFLSKAEKAQLRLRSQSGQSIVDLL